MMDLVEAGTRRGLARTTCSRSRAGALRHLRPKLFDFVARHRAALERSRSLLQRVVVARTPEKATVEGTVTCRSSAAVPWRPRDLEGDTRKVDYPPGLHERDDRLIMKYSTTHGSD